METEEVIQSKPVEPRKPYCFPVAWPTRTSLPSVVIVQPDSTSVRRIEPVAGPLPAGQSPYRFVRGTGACIASAATTLTNATHEYRVIVASPALRGGRDVTGHVPTPSPTRLTIILQHGRRHRAVLTHHDLQGRHHLFHRRP